MHENSSPYYPQSNGLSESAVKQMKFLLEKVGENLDEFSSSLLEFRNTPNVSGKSPAQMFLDAVSEASSLISQVQTTWTLPMPKLGQTNERN